MPPIDPQREPSAELRTAARALREYYVALIREGFTETETLRIIGYMLSAQGRTGE